MADRCLANNSPLKNACQVNVVEGGEPALPGSGVGGPSAWRVAVSHSEGVFSKQPPDRRQSAVRGGTSVPLSKRGKPMMSLVAEPGLRKKKNPKFCFEAAWEVRGRGKRRERAGEQPAECEPGQGTLSNKARGSGAQSRSGFLASSFKRQKHRRALGWQMK